MPPDPPSPGTPAYRFGAPREAAVPQMETVRVTAPDLARRAAIEKSRGRLVVTACGFAVLFLAVILKLADATIIDPMQPRREATKIVLPSENDTAPTGAHFGRAMITDRNGAILAVSLPTASLYANPREMIDPVEAAAKLKQVLPDIDEAVIRARLTSAKQFVYIDRQVTPRQQLAVMDLGVPGLYFDPTERRRYPQGRAAAQVLGGVDVDEHGVAGVEKFFDKRLRDDPEPLRLSIDLRVQAVVRDELSKAIDSFTGIGGAGIVMDVNTGEVLAMVSLPDYDANDFGNAPPDARFNRAVTGAYEPGSTFKLQTVSMALDSGIVHIWNGFDATHPIRAGRFTINDFEGEHRFLYIPEIIAYSSNIGAAHMAVAVGSDIQRAFLQRMGMFSRVPIELPEAALPIVPPASRWKELTTMTVAFGQGIALTPLHIVAGTAAVADGGIYRRPTLLAHMPGDPPEEGYRVISEKTSDTVRKLMRIVVGGSVGTGKKADVPGFYVGGKTGTAQKTGGGHGYIKNARIAAFMAVFPMQAPRYAVYMMVDEPKPNAHSGGFATAGVVAAPAAGAVISRIGPMLGVLPDTQDAAAINAALYLPLQPARPPGAPATVPPAPGMQDSPTARGAVKAAPGRPQTRDVQAQGGRPLAPARPLPVRPLTAPPLPAINDLRHQADWRVPLPEPPPAQPPATGRAGH
jgi:cell division protein FtsI (penicillin-binding protein 3)